jgi:hypothetical protein
MPRTTDDDSLAGRIFGGSRRAAEQPPGIEAENRALWTLVEELSTQLSKEAARRVRLETLLAGTTDPIDGRPVGTEQVVGGAVGTEQVVGGLAGTEQVVGPPSGGSSPTFGLGAGRDSSPSTPEPDDPEERESAAFDRFFAAPDPDLDQTRRFLLE